MTKKVNKTKTDLKSRIKNIRDNVIAQLIVVLIVFASSVVGTKLFITKQTIQPLIQNVSNNEHTIDSLKNVLSNKKDTIEILKSQIEDCKKEITTIRVKQNEGIVGRDMEFKAPINIHNTR